MNYEFAPELVRSEVRQLLASEPFTRSRRMQRFLDYIVEEALAGRASELSEYTIGLSVFDRDSDWEPALDPIVRNDARRLRAKLLECYRMVSPALIIEIPKGGYLPVFQRAAVRTESKVIGFPSSHSTQRLGVLPFECLADTAQCATHGRALSVLLNSRLTGTTGVQVVAQGFLRETEWNVTYLVHGSIFGIDEDMRAVISLIRTDDGSQLWAREFDFNTHSAMKAHGEIAEAVRSEILCRLHEPLRASLSLAA